MSQTKVSEVGTFCWIETATSDPDTTAAFYNHLFGWERTDIPMGGDMVYTMLGSEEATAAGMFALDDKMKEAGASPHWMSYVGVEELEPALEKVKELGGQVCKGPLPAGDYGRFAIVVDPTGATFSLWQTLAESKPFAKLRHGALVWNELVSSDLEKAEKFYCELFGWESKRAPVGDGQFYVEFSYQGQAVGGLTPLPESWPQESRWLVYIAVADCEASTRSVQELGGQVMVEIQSLPEVGTFSVVADSAGAVFSLIQLP